MPQETKVDLVGPLWTVGPQPGRMAGVHIWMAGRGQLALQTYVNNSRHWNKNAIH